MLITPKNYKWHDVEHTLSWDIKEEKLNLQQEFIKYFAWSQFIKSRHYAYLSIKRISTLIGSINTLPQKSMC